MRTAILLLVLLFACKPTPEPVPTPAMDATSASCFSAAQTLSSLGCKDAHGVLYSQPASNGETFQQTCTRALEAGAIVPIVCLTNAQTCEEAKACR
jgi:hypothetical protein